MKTWFTSDTHFGHANIIKYCKRPFRDLEHMDRTIIRNWNERVKEEDFVIFLGDFIFKNTINMSGRGEGTIWTAERYIKKLNGNITFVCGNHDNNNSLNSKIKSLVIEIGGKKIFCTHNPVDIDMRYGINLVGHVHELWKTKKVISERQTTNLVNVGVDVNKFRPISINEIMKIIEENKKKENK